MNLEQARINMVEQQIRTWEVLDQEVLDLLYVIPREEFVPPQRRALAFSDLELPLEEGTKAGDGERMWQPKLEARLLQELALKRTDRVLEVGTGSGYLTALMAHRAAEVCSVEIRPALAAFGRSNLERHGADNVILEVGDAALEQAMVSSQSSLDSNKLGYVVGVRINIDVLNAQQQLYSTRRDLAVARYNTITNQLRLKAGAGSLREEDLEEVNRALAP